MVMGGFALAALASIISYLMTVTNVSYTFDSFKSFFIPLVNVLTPVVLVVVWWFLSQLTPVNEAQCSIVQRAYLAMAVVELLVLCSVLFDLIPYQVDGGFWINASLLLYAIGTLTAALGLVLLSRVVAKDPSVFVDGRSN
jgi:hypothetical protein